RSVDSCQFGAHRNNIQMACSELAAELCLTSLQLRLLFAEPTDHDGRHHFRDLLDFSTAPGKVARLLQVRSLIGDLGARQRELRIEFGDLLLADVTTHAGVTETTLRLERFD